MPDKFQLHVSGLEMLSKCGIQFERRYLNGEKIPPGVSLIQGIAVHRAVALDLKAKIEVGSLLPDAALQETIRDSVSAEWDKGITLDDEERKEGEAIVHGRAIDTAVSLGAKHHAELAPKLQPIPGGIERPWVLDVQGENFQLAGTIDIQETNMIRDTKTSKKSPAASVVDESLQLTGYSLAVKVLDGEAPEKVGLDYLVSLKRGPKIVNVESTRTDEDRQMFLERVSQAKRVIDSGLFMPASTGSWFCAKKWCGYWETCRFAARPKAIVIGGSNGNE